MANGTREQAKSNLAVVLGLIIAAPVLLSPLFVGLVQSADQKTARELDPEVERVQRRLDRLDEHLTFTQALRERLAAEGVEYSADAAEKRAESESGKKRLDAIDEELRKGTTLRTDKLLDALKSDEARKARGLGRWKSARESFAELQKRIKENSGLIKTAESEIKAALTKAGSFSDKTGQDLWANHIAALVAWTKGRQAYDEAWLDRWQAGERRMVAKNQMIEASKLRRMSSAAGGRTPDEAIETITADKSKTEEQLTAAQGDASDLKGSVEELRGRIESLRKKAASAREQIARMDLRPFKASNPRQAGAEFESYRQTYESLSTQARAAESEADTLQYGALRGGTMIESPDGNLLAATYEGGKVAPGLVQLEAQLEAKDKVVAERSAAVKENAAALESLRGQAQELDTAKAAFTKSADERAAEAGTTLEAIEKRMASAQESEDAARKAFGEGERYALAAQTAAKLRVGTANKIQQEQTSDQRSARLLAVINDKDTEAGTLVLAGTLAWARAETNVQAMKDIESHQRLLELRSKLLGVEAGTGEEAAGQLAKWRDEAVAAVTVALKHLDTAKKQIATATYDDIDGQRVSGAALRWQVSQLEGAAHLLKVFLAETPELAEDAKAKAREALQEALSGRENSPLLEHADATLRLLQ